MAMLVMTAAIAMAMATTNANEGNNMSYTYGSQPPPISPLGGQADDGRNRLTGVMLAMQNIQQPPGGMASPGVPGLPPDLGQQGMMGQPPADASGMGGAAGTMPGQGVGLPSAPPQPGQLPLSMQPSAVMGGSGAPMLPMPPRQGM